MQSRMTISCEDNVAFVISLGRARPTALRYPLWLKVPANDRATARRRLRVIGSLAPVTAVS
jgi:hypothetical protein